MTSTSFGGVGRLIVGLLLITLGILLLINQVFDVDIFSMTWPLFIILPGLIMLLAAAGGGERARSLAVPGSIVTTVGLLLLVQQTFDLYASWAYAWSLIAPTAVGFGIWLSGRLEENEKQQVDGVHLMEIGISIFVVGFIFFEMFLNLNDFFGRTSAAVLGGVLLVVGGGLLILRGYNRGKDRSGSQM